MSQRTIVRLLRGLGLLVTSAVLTAGSCKQDIGKGDQPGIYTVRVSVDGAGAEVIGTSLGAIGSQSPSVSADGRFVAFESDAVNLVSGDGNGFPDIFVKDRTNGGVILASVNTDAALPSNGKSGNPALSANGLFVAFESEGRLAIGGTPVLNEPHIYWHDIAGNVTRRIALLAVPAGGLMLHPSISGDGLLVAFESNITNIDTLLGPYLLGARQQIYVADMSTTPATITMVSHKQGMPGTPGNNHSTNPRISKDGTTIVFASDASDLLAAGVDTNGHRDVFAGTPAGADCVRISVRDGISAVECNQDSYSPSVSSDGRFVAFTTSDSVITAGGPTVIAIRDRSLNTTIAISVHPAGGVVLNPDVPSISDDGQVIAFRGDLSAAGGAGNTQIWVRNLASSAAELVSLHLSGATAAANCDRPSLSGNGVWVAWDTPAANLITTDSNGQSDVFMRGPLR
jgi:TolB protein